ncbi:MAG: flagellar biosynthesis protein FlhB [Geminicoccaceae bacterium]
MAEEQDDSQKTEDPSQKRLDDAREKGQTASSREVSNLLLIGSATLVLAIALPGAMRDLALALSHYLRHAGDPALGAAALGGSLRRALAAAGLALLVPLLVTLVASVAAPALQGALVWTTQSLMPKAERISPIAGFKRLFSLKSLVEFIKGLVKVGLMTVIGIVVVWPDRQRLLASGQLEIAAALVVLWEMAIRVSGAIAVCLVLVAGLDYAYQRFEFMKQMRMSRRDLQDEHKQSDGDPVVKQRLRSLRMEKARRRMMAEVPTSTVVITNPTHFAVALRYEPGETPAPKLVAKGVDSLALRIRELAQEHDVPIVESPPLARALHRSVELGALIPQQHYQAVAEIIGYVMRLRQAGGGVRGSVR